MTAQMTSSEITEWMAHFALHPADSHQKALDARLAGMASMVEIMLAKIATLVHNGAGRMFKKPAKLEDFLLQRAKAAPKRKQTKDEMLAAREVLRAGFGGKRR